MVDSYQKHQLEVFNSRRTVFSGVVDKQYAELVWDMEGTFHLYNQDGDLVDYLGDRGPAVHYTHFTETDFISIVRKIRKDAGKRKNRWGETI